MAKPGTTGLKRIMNAGIYSMMGFKAALKYEAAFRQDCILALILWIAAPFVAHGATQLVLLVACPFLILLAEILNSAVEAVVDRISDERHPLSGRAKDMGSAAVFLMLTLTTVTWVIIIAGNAASWY